MLAVILCSCEKYLDIDVPHDQLVPATVFSDEALADGAIAGIYQEMMFDRATNFANGGTNSVTALMDVASGALVFNHGSAEVEAFEARNWLPANSMVYVLWSSTYKAVFRANEVLEGLTVNKESLTSALAARLRGEALFVRAFCHAQLVPLFGGVPLVITTDYRITSRLPRTTPEEIYNQLEKDLREAMEILPADYSHAFGERMRPNRWAAALLLARIYLYQQRWKEAAHVSSTILAHNDLYELVPSTDVYLKDNKEAIWQLLVLENSRATHEGLEGLPNPVLNTPPRFSYSATAMEAFDSDDQRTLNWVGSYTMPDGEQVYNFINKYKIRSNPVNVPPNEASMVMRLTEAYLIRAEARIRMDDGVGALADINTVRMKHGGLTPLNELNADVLMDVIERERLIEFTYEWGHRWSDLKRWGRNEALLPIPYRELEANPFLVQNIGY
ncbi:MAG TPA: RagB/SusD family nutrient uptake outer membrane protein [Parapedobacter sp.]|nr:RagB/SusD family nutrient uptake outer membrane protein [Parapedobacter sp.]